MPRRNIHLKDSADVNKCPKEFFPPKASVYKVNCNIWLLLTSGTTFNGAGD